MKKIIISSFLFAIIFVLYFQKQKEQNPITIQEPPKQITLEDARNLISEKDCQINIEFLASDELEGRMSGKKGNQLAAEYIKNKLDSYGLKTILQKFNIKKINNGPKNESGENWTENVYGVKEGTDLKDEILVIGAHFDHIGYGPQYSRSRKIDVHNGADDNASGSVALLEIAKALSKLNPRRTVVFQFYSAEEMGLIGSRYYCDNPILPEKNPNIKNHIAMINLDMVGHLKSRTNKVSDFKFDMNQEVKKLLPEYPFALKVIAKGGGSDHVSFSNKGIPSVFIHTGTHPYYHTPEDDVSTLDIKGISEISKFAFDLAWNLANENKPEKTVLETLPFDHDHGEESF